MRFIPIVGLLSWLLVSAGPSSSSAVETSSATLVRKAAHHRSYKVRVHALLTLVRRKDPRAAATLLTALNDKHPLVRGVAADRLGRLEVQTAREALRRALQDPNAFVRGRASGALDRLDGPIPEGAIRSASNRLYFLLGTIGDATGAASPALREQLRKELVRALSRRRLWNLELGPRERRGYLVDSTIKKLVQTADGGMVTCEVELVLSTYPARSIVMMTTGEASIEAARRGSRPQIDPSMASDALVQALRAAHQNLTRYLQAQR